MTSSRRSGERLSQSEGSGAARCDVLLVDLERALPFEEEDFPRDFLRFLGGFKRGMGFDRVIAGRVLRGEAISCYDIRLLFRQYAVSAAVRTYGKIIAQMVCFL